LPPLNIYHPFLVVHTDNYKELFKRKFEHAILDIRISRFRLENVDYPRSFLIWYKHKARELCDIFGERLWCCIPDYPFHKTSSDRFSLKAHDNVRKTIEKIKDFYSIDGVNWLIPVQHNQTLESLAYACDEIRSIITNKSNPLAIGSLCIERNIEHIVKICYYVRKRFSNWLHGFGVHLWAVRKLFSILDSFDSLSYIRSPRGKGLTCRSTAERVLYFQSFLNRFNELKAGFFLQNTPKEFMKA